MLRPIAFVVTSVLLVSSCSSGGDEPPAIEGLLGEEPPVALDTSTTTGADGDVTTTTATGSSAGVTSTTTSGSATSDGPDRRGLQPVPGTYTYLNGDGASADDVSHTVTVAGNDTVAFHDLRRDQELTRRELVIEAGTFFITREQRTDGSATGRECPWSNRLIWVPGDLDDGTTWETTGSCSTETDVGTFSRERTIAGGITGTTTVDIDGRTHLAVTLRRETQTTTTGVGIDIVEQLVEDVVWVPRLSLEARVDASQVVTSGGVEQGRAMFSVTLASATPA